jgi:hypothetical protein
LVRYSPKDTIPFFLSNSANVTLLNNIFLSEDSELKNLTQLCLLIMTEIIRFFNLNKKNINDIGIDLARMTSYVNKLLSVHLNII